MEGGQAAKRGEAGMMNPELLARLAGVRSALLFGGTFDPPHQAHVTLARQAIQQLDADALLVVPAGRSPFKQGQAQTPGEHRLAMTRLAMQEVPQAIVLDWEITGGDGEPTYTINTARRVRKALPVNAELHLLIGADQVMSFAQWKDAKQLGKIAPPVVLARPPHDAEAMRCWLLHHAPAFMRGLTVIDAPLMDVSATKLRSELHDRAQVPDAIMPTVWQYIREHGLYQRTCS
jgi:nicotinate-nucleotide adenylyltransferase